LICWMLHAMFKEMLKRRQPGTMYAVFSGGQTVRSDEELRCKCASIIQGTVSAHKFMKELVNDNFVRHPIFNATMLDFLLKNKASQNTLGEVVTKLGSLESKVKGVQALVDKVQNNQKQGGNNNNIKVK
jgi:hypothetical protein